MHVKTYPDSGALLADAQDFFEMEEVKNSIMLSALLSLAPGSEHGKEPQFLATVWNGFRLNLVAFMAPPGPLLLSSYQEYLDTAVESLAGNLLASGVHVSGVRAPCALAADFASAWTRIAGAVQRPGTHEREFVLREVVFRGTASGCLRPATAEDLDRLIQWGLAFHSDIRMPLPTSQIEARVRSKLDSGDMHLWEDGGTPTSMAGKVGATSRSARIGLVYTPPELRGRGYATSCVAHLSQQILDSEKEICTLSTDLANRISNRIYERIGYRLVHDVDNYKFEPSST